MSVLRISRGYSLSRHSILCVGKLNPRFKNNGGSYMKKLSVFGLVVGATLFVPLVAGANAIVIR